MSTYYYCAWADRTGHFCEGQCLACNRADNMPETSPQMKPSSTLHLIPDFVPPSEQATFSFTWVGEEYARALMDKLPTQKSMSVDAMAVGDLALELVDFHALLIERKA